MLTIVGNLLADVLYRPGPIRVFAEVAMILSSLCFTPPPAAGGYPVLAHITLSWRRDGVQLRCNRLAMFCLILLAVMAVWCVLGPGLVAVER